MGHIFISYSHKDKKYVHKLQEVLQKEGFEVWIDDRINYGTEWPKAIQKYLDECSAFIVVVSENAYDSKWVQNEVARANRKRKPFFPLLLHGDPWLAVEATQYFDVRNGILPDEEFFSLLAATTPRIAKVSEDLPSLKNPPSSRINFSKIWNAKTRKLLTRTGIAIVSFAVMLFSMFGIGKALGFVDTDNSSIRETSLISNFVISTDINSKHDRYAFAKNQEIYTHFDLRYKTSATYICKWYYVTSLLGNDINILITTLKYNATPSNSSIYFQLTNPKIAGNYRVDIYRGQTLLGRRYFSIE